MIEQLSLLNLRCNRGSCNNCFLYSEGYCEGCKATYRCRGVVYCKKQCNKCYSPCSRQQDIDLWFWEVFSNIGKIEDTNFDFDSIPRYIPQIKGNKFSTPLDISAFAVGIDQVISPKKLKLTKNILEINKKFNIGNNAVSIIQSYARDDHVERMWAMAKKLNLYGKLSSVNPGLVTSIDFSVYDDEPRSWQLIAIYRSIKVYNELIRNDIPSILHVFWATDYDLKRWIEIINKNKISAIAVNFQTFKIKNYKEKVLKDLKVFKDGLDHDVRLLASGIDSHEYIKRLKNIFPSLYLINLKAYSEGAIKGARLNIEDSRKRFMETYSEYNQLLN